MPSETVNGLVGNTASAYKTPILRTKLRIQLPPKFSMRYPSFYFQTFSFVLVTILGTVQVADATPALDNVLEVRWNNDCWKGCGELTT
jgi:hypothetical protein